MNCKWFYKFKNVTWWRSELSTPNTSSNAHHGWLRDCLWNWQMSGFCSRVCERTLQPISLIWRWSSKRSVCFLWWLPIIEVITHCIDFATGCINFIFRVTPISHFQNFFNFNLFGLSSRPLFWFWLFWNFFSEKCVDRWRVFALIFAVTCPLKIIYLENKYFSFARMTEIGILNK